jgi:hypothetical protein
METTAIKRIDPQDGFDVISTIDVYIQTLHMHLKNN